jgi:hypothetical protein
LAGYPGQQQDLRRPPEEAARIEHAREESWGSHQRQGGCHHADSRAGLGFPRAKAFLHRLGYEARRARPVNDIDHAAARSISDGEYYTEWSTPCPLFSPWLGDADFREIYESARRHSTVARERCDTLVSLARHAAQLDGAVADAVYKGGTAFMLSRVIAEAGKRACTVRQLQRPAEGKLPAGPLVP